jgi:hypothetical protein
MACGTGRTEGCRSRRSRRTSTSLTSPRRTLRSPRGPVNGPKGRRFCGDERGGRLALAGMGLDVSGTGCLPCLALPFGLTRRLPPFENGRHSSPWPSPCVGTAPASRHTRSTLSGCQQ